MAELGGSQISALLESVPGIAKVLRSPVADALVAMIRAGAGLDEFRLADVDELVQYSVRRGLISADEGERLTAEVKATGKGRARGVKSTGRRRSRPAKSAKPAGRKTPSIGKRKSTTKKASRAKKTAAKRTASKRR